MDTDDPSIASHNNNVMNIVKGCSTATPVVAASRRDPQVPLRLDMSGASEIDLARPHVDEPRVPVRAADRKRTQIHVDFVREQKRSVPSTEVLAAMVSSPFAFRRNVSLAVPCTSMSTLRVIRQTF